MHSGSFTVLHAGSTYDEHVSTLPALLPIQLSAPSTHVSALQGQFKRGADHKCGGAHDRYRNKAPGIELT